MIEVKLFDYVTDKERLGNGEGQGLYKYKTSKNFLRYVIRDQKHVLHNTLKNGKYYAKIYNKAGLFQYKVTYNEITSSNTHFIEKF